MNGKRTRKGKKVLCVEENRVFDMQKTAAAWAGVTTGSIGHAIKTNGTSAGYHWRLVDDQVTISNMRRPSEEEEERDPFISADGVTPVQIGDWVLLPGEPMGCDEVTGLRRMAQGEYRVDMQDGAFSYRPEDLKVVSWDQAQDINDSIIETDGNELSFLLKMTAMTSHAYENVEDWWLHVSPRFTYLATHLMRNWMRRWAATEMVPEDSWEKLLKDVRSDNKEEYDNISEWWDDMGGFYAQRAWALAEPDKEEVKKEAAK